MALAIHRGIFWLTLDPAHLKVTARANISPTLAKQLAPAHRAARLALRDPVLTFVFDYVALLPVFCRSTTSPNASAGLDRILHHHTGSAAVSWSRLSAPAATTARSVELGRLPGSAWCATVSSSPAADHRVHLQGDLKPGHRLNVWLFTSWCSSSACRGRLAEASAGSSTTTTRATPGLPSAHGPGLIRRPRRACADPVSTYAAGITSACALLLHSA